LDYYFSSGEKGLGKMPFEEFRKIIARERWPANPRKPAWEDFENRIPIQRPIYDDVRKSFRNNQFALVVGGVNRGKTFLAYSVGFDTATKENWVVKYALVTDTDYAEEIREIENFHSYTKSKFLFIVDDCQKDQETFQKFSEWVMRAGAGACHFLFCMRGERTDEPVFDLIANKQAMFVLDPSEAHIKAIVRAYIRCIEADYPTSKHLRPADIEVEEFIQAKVGTDLDRLIRFLKAWDPIKQDLKDVSEDRILQHVWSVFGLDSPTRRELLSVASALGQFDIYINAHYLEHEPFNDQIQLLLDERRLLIERTNLGRAYGLADQKESEYIFRAIVNDLKVNETNYCAQLIIDYLKSSPPNIIWAFNALEQNGRRDLIKKVFKDTQVVQVLARALAGRSLNAIDRIVTRLEIIEPRLTLTLLADADLMDRYRALTKAGPASRIRHALAGLHGVEAKRNFFTDWCDEDYLKAINSTRQLNTFRLLLYDLEQSKLPDVAIRFATQLSKAELHQLLDVSKGTKWIDLNHLIGNMRISPDELRSFLQRLVVLDLNTLFAISQPSEIQWFLWQLMRYDVASAKVFIERHVGPLGELLQRSQLPGIFWLIWNIFQTDKKSAADIVKAKRQAILQVKLLGQEPIMILAWHALLEFCELDLSFYLRNEICAHMPVALLASRHPRIRRSSTSLYDFSFWSYICFNFFAGRFRTCVIHRFESSRTKVSS
jgi:hypothetical protein